MKEGTMWIELVSNTSQSKATKKKQKKKEKKKKAAYIHLSYPLRHKLENRLSEISTKQ